VFTPHATSVRFLLSSRVKRLTQQQHNTDNNTDNSTEHTTQHRTTTHKIFHAANTHNAAYHTSNATQHTHTHHNTRDVRGVCSLSCGWCVVMLLVVLFMCCRCVLCCVYNIKHTTHNTGSNTQHHNAMQSN
jgi:hypothetical protein